jgi:hypothetical protein
MIPPLAPEDNPSSDEDEVVVGVAVAVETGTPAVEEMVPVERVVEVDVAEFASAVIGIEILL